MRRKSIDSCLRRHVIPVVWEPAAHRDLLARASAIFLQGGALNDLGPVLDAFSDHGLAHLPLFVHIDLVSGLENSEAGLEYLAGFERITGVVTVHHHLSGAARRLGLLSVVRLFLSDSRAVDRGLSAVYCAELHVSAGGVFIPRALHHGSGMVLCPDMAGACPLFRRFGYAL